MCAEPKINKLCSQLILTANQNFYVTKIVMQNLEFSLSSLQLDDK
jgi:hypothetical protein